jgi:hypothetical protein
MANWREEEKSSDGKSSPKDSFNAVDVDGSILDKHDLVEYHLSWRLWYPAV